MILNRQRCLLKCLLYKWSAAATCNAAQEQLLRAVSESAGMTSALWLSRADRPQFDHAFDWTRCELITLLCLQECSPAHIISRYKNTPRGAEERCWSCFFLARAYRTDDSEASSLRGEFWAGRHSDVRRPLPFRLLLRRTPLCIIDVSDITASSGRRDNIAHFSAHRKASRRMLHVVIPAPPARAELEPFQSSVCSALMYFMTPKRLSLFDVGSKAKPTPQGPAEFSSAYLAHISDLGAIASSRTSTDTLEWSHEL